MSECSCLPTVALGCVMAKTQPQVYWAPDASFSVLRALHQTLLHTQEILLASYDLALLKWHLWSADSVLECVGWGVEGVNNGDNFQPLIVSLGESR